MANPQELLLMNSMEDVVPQPGTLTTTNNCANIHKVSMHWNLDQVNVKEDDIQYLVSTPGAFEVVWVTLSYTSLEISI